MKIDPELFKAMEGKPFRFEIQKRGEESARQMFGIFSISSGIYSPEISPCLFKQTREDGEVWYTYLHSFSIDIQDRISFEPLELNVFDAKYFKKLDTKTKGHIRVTTRKDGRFTGLIKEISDTEVELVLRIKEHEADEAVFHGTIRIKYEDILFCEETMNIWTMSQT